MDSTENCLLVNGAGFVAQGELLFDDLIFGNVADVTLLSIQYRRAFILSSTLGSACRVALGVSMVSDTFDGARA